LEIPGLWLDQGGAKIGREKVILKGEGIGGGRTFLKGKNFRKGANAFGNENLKGPIMWPPSG